MMGKQQHQMRHVFILTYGRSGSTLLQGILNASPRVHCAGENGDYLYNLFQAARTLSATKKMVGPNKGRDPRDPFFGIDFYSEPEVLEDFNTLVSRQIMNSCPKEKEPDFIGFKEIRYPFKEDLPSYLEFIEKVFEYPILIFLYRDIQAVLQSGMFADLPDEARKTHREKFLNFENITGTFSETRDNCVIIRYEEFKAAPSEILEKLRTVGLPISTENLTETLKIPHSYVWKDENV